MNRTTILIPFFLLIGFPGIPGWNSPAYSQPVFTQLTISGQTQGTQSLFAYDMDNDGDTDILGAAAEDNDILFWRNDGGNPVSWLKQDIVSDFTSTCIGIAVDLDGDTDMDIAAASGHEGNQQVRWYRQNPENLLSYPESAVYDPDSNRYLVSCQGTGSIVAIDAQGNQSVFASGFGIVIGLTRSADTLFAVCDNTVLGLSLTDATVLFEHAIPEAVKLNDIATGNGNTLYVSDVLGDQIFRIYVASNSHEVFAEDQLVGPNGILVEQEQNRLLVVSWRTHSPVQAVDLSTGNVSTVIPTALSNCDGITRDSFGRYYISEWAQGTIQRFNPAFQLPSETLYTTTQSPADIWFNPFLDEIAIPLCTGHAVDFLPVYPVAVEKKRTTMNSRCYPNPFSTDATLEIHLDQPGMVQADLSDLTGKLLHPICRQQLPAGIHKIPFTGENLGAGIYIVYLSVKDQKDPERVLLKEVISVEKTNNHINQ